MNFSDVGNQETSISMHTVFDFPSGVNSKVKPQFWGPNLADEIFGIIDPRKICTIHVDLLFF